MSVIVPEDIICSNYPIVFYGSYIDGYPFPKLIDVGLKMLKFDP